MPRDHVIDCQFACTRPAVLASVVISHKHLAPCDAHRYPRSPHVVSQANNARPRARSARGSDRCPACRKHFGLLRIDEGDSAAKATDVEWLKVNVQDKHPVDRVVTSPRM